MYSRRMKTLFVLALLFAPSAWSDEPNVILISLDGVRPEEFSNKPDPLFSPADSAEIMPHFWSTLVKEGVLIGMPGSGSVATVANTANVSLPGYHGLMAGQPTGCGTNSCGRTTVETLGERLVRELKLKREQVALVASWTKLPLAFESTQGKTFTNGGFEPLDDKELNRDQVIDMPPWKENRFDKYTWGHAMGYLEKHRPRFLYVSINDTDDWAHLNDYPKTLGALRMYDGWLKDFFKKLDSMGDYGKNTTVLLTTDHGRGGTKATWKDHGSSIPESREIWIYARGPKTARKGVIQGGPVRTHSDIRPTIESIFGLKPIECATCGKPIPEIVSGR